MGTWHGTRDTNTSLCKSSLNRGRNSVHATAIESWLTTDIPRVFLWIDRFSIQSINARSLTHVLSFAHTTRSHKPPYLTIIEILLVPLIKSILIINDRSWIPRDSFLTQLFCVNKLKMLWKDRLINCECDSIFNVRLDNFWKVWCERMIKLILDKR